MHYLYYLYDFNNNLVKIGISKPEQITRRLKSNRFKIYKDNDIKIWNIKLSACKNITDAKIYEIYLRAKLNPLLDEPSDTYIAPTIKLPKLKSYKYPYYCQLNDGTIKINKKDFETLNYEELNPEKSYLYPLTLRTRIMLLFQKIKKMLVGQRKFEQEKNSYDCQPKNKKNKLVQCTSEITFNEDDFFENNQNNKSKKIVNIDGVEYEGF
uniref:hypothetical protein n=1 Tax=Acetivibrio cellulolyticus TaxID=35830 RepID=UPI0001E2C789|nr:hypothetical protein [Acetivibrio cellulolyticus]